MYIYIFHTIYIYVCFLPGGFTTYLGEPIKAAQWCPFDERAAVVMSGVQFVAVLPSGDRCTDSRETFSAAGSIQICRIAELTRLDRPCFCIKVMFVRFGKLNIILTRYCHCEMGQTLRLYCKHTLLEL